MKKIIIFLSFFLVVGSACAQKQKPLVNHRHNIDKRQKQKQVHQIKIDENYRFTFFYIAKGSRSEGVHGELYYKGTKVAKNLDPVKTEYGIFHYHGDYMQRGNLFDTSGWLPENLREIYPSSFTKYK